MSHHATAHIVAVAEVVVTDWADPHLWDDNRVLHSMHINCSPTGSVPMRVGLSKGFSSRSELHLDTYFEWAT